MIQFRAFKRSLQHLCFHLHTTYEPVPYLSVMGSKMFLGWFEFAWTPASAPRQNSHLCSGLKEPSMMYMVVLVGESGSPKDQLYVCSNPESRAACSQEVCTCQDLWAILGPIEPTVLYSGCTDVYSLTLNEVLWKSAISFCDLRIGGMIRDMCFKKVSPGTQNATVTTCFIYRNQNRPCLHLVVPCVVVSGLLPTFICMNLRF